MGGDERFGWVDGVNEIGILFYTFPNFVELSSKLVQVYLHRIPFSRNKDTKDPPK